MVEVINNLHNMIFDQQTRRREQNHMHDYIMHLKLCGLEIPDTLEFASHWEIVQYKRNEYFFKKGEPLDKLGFIMTGGVKVKGEPSEKPFINELYIERSFCGAPLPTQAARIADFNAECLKNTTIIVISHEKLQRLIAAYPQFGEFLNQITQKQLAFLQRRILSFQVMNARQRYVEFVESQPMILQQFSLSDIALYLGIEPETLSRLRGKIYKYREAS